MKGKLIKTSDGIIFIIDERPKIGDWGFSTFSNIYVKSNRDIKSSNIHKILASTFGVGLELYMLLEQEMDLILPLEDCLHVEFNTEYPYKIEDGKVIIEI